MKFRDHKYTFQKSHSYAYHSWSFRGPHGGIEFTSSYEDKREFHHFGTSCGLEFHHSFDPTGGLEAPHHKDCHVIGGHCWHDGTSLYASETLWPIISSLMPDHNSIFNLLEREYERHFDKDVSE